MADVNVAEQLDNIERRVMAGLKDFPKATVDCSSQNTINHPYTQEYVIGQGK